jgi:lipid-binding SYLF domain-containing protein
LKQAKGLAILTIAKVGVMVTYNIGTGLVVSRREDGSWSPPSAISSFGMGWGAQVNIAIICYIYNCLSPQILHENCISSSEFHKHLKHDP